MSDRLPVGWEWTTIGEVVLNSVEQAEPGPSEVNYIDIGSIDRERKQIGEPQPITNATAPTRARQWVRSGDVLVSMTRPNLNAVALVPPTLDGSVASTGFDVLRAIEVLPDWIFHRVRTFEFIADVCTGLQGVVYPAIRPKDVRQHRLPIPPLQEQRRIVSAIDSYLSRLDDAVAGLERAQRNLKRYRASVLQAAAEGRLVPTEAELARTEGRDYEPASELLKRILAERRRRWEEAELEKLKASGNPPADDRWKKKYREPAPPDTARLPELAEGWCWATLAQLSWDSSYGTSRKCSYDGAGEPVLRIPNVQNGMPILDDLKRAAMPLAVGNDEFLAPGDFLVIRTNGSRNLIARAALIRDHLAGPHFFASYLIRFRLVLGEEVGRWLLTLWHSPEMRRTLEGEAATSAGQYNVSQTALMKKCVPLPPAAEQQRLATEVEHLISVADAAEQSVSDNLTRSARLKQSVLSWAFEGKLVDQDPNDEPAAALLERIRKSREADGGQAKARRHGRRRASA